MAKAEKLKDVVPCSELPTTAIKLPDALQTPTLAEAPPGSAWSIPLGNVWVSIEDSSVFVNTGCALLLDDFEEDKTARIIVVEEGYILDLFSAGLLEEIRFTPKPFDEHVKDLYGNIGEYKPIIQLVISDSDLKAIEDIFCMRYGRTIEGHQIDQKVKKADKKKSGNKKKPSTDSAGLR